LTARVLDTTLLQTRLSLFDAAGELLFQSEGQSIDDHDPLLVQYVTGSATGTPYFLTVEGLDGATGTYSLDVDFQSADPPLRPLTLPRSASAVIAQDFNRDGFLDMAAVDPAGAVAVFLGQGDGSFSRAGVFPAGSGARYLLAADFNGDGIPD